MTTHTSPTSPTPAARPLQVGDHLRLTLVYSTLPDQTYQGILTEIEPAGFATNGMPFPPYAVLCDPDGNYLASFPLDYDSNRVSHPDAYRVELLTPPPAGPVLTPRQRWFLDLLASAHPDGLHVCAHRTTVGAAMIDETGDGISHPVTLRPLGEAGLIHVGDLADLRDPAWDRWDLYTARLAAYRTARRAWVEANPKVVAANPLRWKYLYATTTTAGFEPTAVPMPDYHRRGRLVTLSPAGLALTQGTTRNQEVTR